MRHTVCGRLRSCPFSISTIFPFSSTRRCRLRLPSVSEHSCLRSANVSPLGWVISDVNTLRRARSWMTRLSPAYANRPSREERSLDFIAVLLRAKEHDARHQQLAYAEGNAHGPWRKRTAVSG